MSCRRRHFLRSKALPCRRRHLLRHRHADDAICWGILSWRRHHLAEALCLADNTICWGIALPTTPFAKTLSCRRRHLLRHFILPTTPSRTLFTFRGQNCSYLRIERSRMGLTKRGVRPLGYWYRYRSTVYSPKLSLETGDLSRRAT